MALEDYDLNVIKGVSECLDTVYCKSGNSDAFFQLINNDRNFLTLVDVLGKYNNVFFDTGALIKPSENDLREIDLISDLRKQNIFLNYLNTLALDNNLGRALVFTKGVMGEYLVPFFSEDIPKGFKQTLKSEFKDLDYFVKTFTNKKRILQLNDEEKSVESYYRDCLKKFSISPVDKDLISKACAISQSRGKTAIISNDCPLISSWKYLVKLPFLSINNCHHYKREMFDRYYKTRVD